MSSKTVKQLQKLHLQERSGGLEDLVGLGIIQDGGFESDLLKTNPPAILQTGSPLHSANLSDSIIGRKEKTKVAENEKYYYKSPCPEKSLKHENSHARVKKKDGGLVSSLVESVAHFCKDVKVSETNCKVFVGNISYRTKDRELREAFELFGKVVKASICKDKRTRKSKGFGFVSFSNQEEAKRAINAPDFQLNYDGRLLKVSWAERKRKGKSKGDMPAPGPALEELARSLLEKENMQTESDETEEEEQESIEASLVHQLNDYCLLKIFLYLDLKERIKVERVCKRWQSVSRQTWKSLTTLGFKGMFTPFEGAGGLTDRILYSILKRGCNNLKVLDLSGSPFFVTSVGVHHISKFCTGLKVLNLSNVAVSNQNLKDIALKCEQLETLILGRCRYFGEKGLWWYLKEAKNIQHLEVTDNLRVTGRCLWMMSGSCKVLNLSGCVKIDDTALDNISMKAPELLSLDLSNCLLITDDGLRKIFTNNKKLRQLSLSEAGIAVTSNGLMAIGQLEELECLDLSQVQAVNDNVIIHIATNCKSLRQLNLQACHSGVTDTGIRALSSLVSLEDLNVSYLSEITDDCLAHLAVNTSLKSLTCKACTKISNEGLVSLLLFGSSYLVFVDMSGCYAVDDSILNNEQLKERDSYLPKVTINVGGTSMTQEGSMNLQQKIGNCEILFEKRFISRLRNDYDPTSYAPFDSSEEDDNDDDDDGRPFHPFSPKGYTVRSSDLEDGTLIAYPISHEQAEDFLEADDPALLDELEEEFMFD